MASVTDAATQEERLSMLTRWSRDVTRRSRPDKERDAMPRLSGRGGNRAATRNALVRRKGGAVLDVVHQKVERFLRVRLNEFELLRESRQRRGRVLVGLDMVAVLHFVETV